MAELQILLRCHPLALLSLSPTLLDPHQPTPRRGPPTHIGPLFLIERNSPFRTSRLLLGYLPRSAFTLFATLQPPLPSLFFSCFRSVSFALSLSRCLCSFLLLSFTIPLSLFLSFASSLLFGFSLFRLIPLSLYISFALSISFFSSLSCSLSPSIVSLSYRFLFPFPPPHLWVFSFFGHPDQARPGNRTFATTFIDVSPFRRPRSLLESMPARRSIRARSRSFPWTRARPRFHDWNGDWNGLYVHMEYETTFRSGARRWPAASGETDSSLASFFNARPSRL